MTKEDSSVRETLPEDQAKFIASEQKASLISRATELCISSTPERQDYCSTSTDLSKPLIERKKQLPHAEGFPNLSLPPPIEAESIGSFSTLKHPTELAEITDAVKAHLLQRASEDVQFSPSVTKQNSKTEQLYLNFIQQMGFQSYPITRLGLLTFLIWLAESGRYTAKTLDTVIYYSLCRLNILRTGAPIDRSAQQSALALLRKFRSDKEMKKPRGGMEPIIPDDVSRMVDVMDKGLLITPALASLFNFAMATGARGNSCGEVRLCDLGPLYDNPDGTSLLVVRIVKLKARPHETLQLSLAGRVEIESTIDVLYWMDQHLQRNFQITLRELVSSNKEDAAPRTEKLWPYSTDSMTRYVKSRLEAAGIPPSKFGFHSFRSGFMAACLIQAEKKGESIEDVLTRVAIITGWRPLDRVQFQYLRDAVRRRMVTTDMIGTTKTESFMLAASFEPEGEANHANTFQFHNIPEHPPQPQRRAYVLEVKSYLGQLLYVRSASAAANTQYINRCFDWCLGQLGSEEALESRGGRSLSTLGRQILEERVQSNPGAIKDIAERFFRKLKQGHKLMTTLPEPKPLKKEIKALDQREMTPYGGRERRKPIAWTKEEDDIFMEGVDKKLDRYQIAERLPLRTSLDVYYHLRYLNTLRSKKGEPLLHLKPAPVDQKCKRRRRRRATPQYICHDDSETITETSCKWSSCDSKSDSQVTTRKGSSSEESSTCDDTITANYSNRTKQKAELEKKNSKYKRKNRKMKSLLLFCETD